MVCVACWDPFPRFHSQNVVINDMRASGLSAWKSLLPVNKSNEMPEGNDETMKSSEVIVQIVTLEAQAGQRRLFCETKSAPEVKMFSWSLTRRGLEVKCQKPKIKQERRILRLRHASLTHLFSMPPTHLNSI